MEYKCLSLDIKLLIMDQHCVIAHDFLYMCRNTATLKHDKTVTVSQYCDTATNKISINFTIQVIYFQ